MAIASTRPALRRSPDRLVGGVCAGAAEWLGVDPLVVRLAVVVLALVPGVGVLAYAGAWWLLPLDPRPVPPRMPPHPEWLVARQRDDARTGFGATCLGMGASLLVRTVSDEFTVLAITLIVAGVGVAWVRTDPAERDRLRDAVTRASGSPIEVLQGGAGSLTRLGAGLVLVVAGGIALVAEFQGVSGAGAVLLAAVVSIGGLGLLLGPWALGVLRLAGEERRQRIRSEERAELAAQLHDSVLQTLVLIQRSAPSRPSEAVALARRQERELRSWLYGERRTGDPTGAGPTTLAAALEAVAGEVEADHGIEVELVTVGDQPLDDRTRALVAATREALVNVAKHAGVTTVDCFAESDTTGSRVYVRDRGRGFDPATVAEDRHGIAESITARLARVGGKATITSTLGEGTEVALEVGVSNP